jgi:hypothetical protein
MKFINLCPHPVTLLTNHRPILLPAAVDPVRLDLEELPTDDLGMLYRQRLVRSPIVPPPSPGVLYVVSMLVRLALPHRTDLASPVGLIRDEDGAVVACRALAIGSPFHH